MNVGEDTIRSVFPTESPKLGRQEQERLPSTHNSKRQPERKANLEDWRGSPPQRARDRLARGEALFGGISEVGMAKIH